MTRPPFIHPIDADQLGAQLSDLGLLRAAQRPALAASRAFVGRVVAAPAPCHHVVPVLALAQAAAGLALLFGDPELIDLVAALARATLRNGGITIHDLYPPEGNAAP